jgi:cytochrome P450
MFSRIKEVFRKRLSGKFHTNPSAYARMCGILSTYPMPPGDMTDLDTLERSDRDSLRQRAEELGPIFKGIAWDNLCVCVVGLKLCQEITKTHMEHMSVHTLELEHLIPKGFLSAMETKDHRHYRAIIQTALNKQMAVSDEGVLDQIANTGLHFFAEKTNEHNDDADAFTRALSGIATSMIAWVFFGAKPGTPVHECIIEHFQKLGPYGLVWNPQERQEKAFRAFQEYISNEADTLKDGTGKLSSQGILGQIITQGELDETIIGNLIYQAEMGRFDIKNYFRWLSRHVADDPCILERIRKDESIAFTSKKRSVAEAFALETLRTDQSENLIRRAKRDFIFKGLLIPKFTTIRLCLWEAHHDPENFENPHQFDATRFTETSPSRAQFSPFGLDKHQCPFGTPVIKMGTTFVRSLAQGYNLSQLIEGPEVRGPYHWEPAPKFAVHIEHL